MGELLSNLKRTRRSLAALIIVVVALTGLFGSPAASHDGHDHSREIRIIEVSGLLDPIEIDYSGFEIGPEFVVGYGLDYNGKYRELPYLALLS